MEKYISGQKVYCYKTDTIPVVIVDDEKKKTFKIGYMTLYAKLFMTSQNATSKKTENHFISHDKHMLAANH